MFVLELSKRCFLSSSWLSVVSVKRLKVVVEAEVATFREDTFLGVCLTPYEYISKIELSGPYSFPFIQKAVWLSGTMA